MLGEADVERVAIERLAALGVRAGEGPAFSPDAPAAERATWQAALLDKRLRPRLAAINPFLPADKVAEVARGISRPPHPTLDRASGGVVPVRHPVPRSRGDDAIDPRRRRG